MQPRSSKVSTTLSRSCLKAITAPCRHQAHRAFAAHGWAGRATGGCGRCRFLDLQATGRRNRRKSQHHCQDPLAVTCGKTRRTELGNLRNSLIILSMTARSSAFVLWHLQCTLGGREVQGNDERKKKRQRKRNQQCDDAEPQAGRVGRMGLGGIVPAVARIFPSLV